MPTTFINTGTGANGAGVSTVTLGAVFGFGAGQNGQSVNFQLFNANSPCVVQSVDLTSGDNIISATTGIICPAIATASGVFICPPIANGTTIALKSVVPDVGIAIAFTGAPSFLSFAAIPPESFILNTNSTITNLILVWV